MVRPKLQVLCLRLCILFKFACTVPLGLSLSSIHAQELRDLDRERAETMLRVVQKQLQDHYYDPSFHGLDLDARFKAAHQSLGDATSLDHALAIVAQAVLDLNDSHTFFVPPERTVKVQYGFQMRIVEDQAFVIAVKPKSDAEKKGLKVGDAILGINEIQPTRENVWRLVYRYYIVRPEAGLNLVVQSPGGQPRRIDVLAKVKREQRVVDLTQGDDIWGLIRKAESEAQLHQTYEGKDRKLLIWRMPSFSVDERTLDKLTGKLRKFDSLILDLRGNPGGYKETLTELLGYVFDRDVTVGDAKGKNGKSEPIVAKSQGGKILTDSS